MRAALLTDFGSPMVIQDHPAPQVHRGEVLLAVLATTLLPYTADVAGGGRHYPLEPPVVLGTGAVGRVVETGSDLTKLQVGDVVWVDQTVRSRDDALTPDITLQGWSSRGEGGLRLSRVFHDGPLAEQMLVPAECAYLLPDVDADDIETLARLSTIGIPLVPYGGLQAVGLEPGETVVVSGATGNYGSAGVAVAVAMGAAKVVALGRNRSKLADLNRRFGSRVSTVALTGDATVDQHAIWDAAGGDVDVVLDLLPPEVSSAAVRTAVMTVREYGRVALMGGVGMLGGDDLGLPYPWLMRQCVTVRGQWMYPRSANVRLLALVRAGLLDLGLDTVTTFELAQVNEAVDHAAQHSGPFDRTVVLPQT